LKESSQPQEPLVSSTAAISALILLVALFGNLGAIGLVGPDEPRYAWIARAMAATGDWVTPRLYGQPWFEKPILYYWTAAFGFLLRLPAEWALRLPSAFAALAAAIAIGWLGWNHYGKRAKCPIYPAMLAPLLFATSVAAIGFARAATPDMLFSGSTTLAMASAAAILRRQNILRGIPQKNPPPLNTSAPRLLLFGAFLGLGVLAKGPAAILLAGGAIALWALCTNHWRHAGRLAHPWAILAFCAIAFPWYVLCARRNPDFIYVFIFQHNFQRYLTPVFQHPQPFWFFGPITLLALLPWTALLWPAVQEGRRLWHEKAWRDSPGFFFACWAAFPVLFFSFSQSKLPGYILPAVPPVALLCAGALSRVLSSKHDLDRVESTPKTERMELLSARQAGHHLLRPAAVGTALGLTWVILGASAGLWVRRLPQSESDAVGHTILIVAIIAIFGGIAIVYVALRGKHSFVVASLLLAALSTEIANIGILPALDPYISARWHATLMRDDLHPDHIFTYRLQRSWDYGLAFYFRRELPEWSPANPDPALVLTTPAGLEQIRQLHRFYGSLEEPYKGILYVPIGPKPR
jgi:4-amino-4-deoxy-L-arabinose transferase-like glycosyltransferase